MKQLFYISVVCALAITICGCRDNKQPISEGKMSDIMKDMLLADAYASNHYEYSTDSARNVLRQTILKKHGVTQEEYDGMLDWYAHNIEKYSKLCTEVEKKIDRQEKKLIAGTGESGNMENNSIWPYSSMAMISPLASQNAIQFSIPISDVKPGERFVWKMRLSGPGASQMMLGVEYADGTSSYWQKRTSQKELEMSLQSDSTRSVTRIFGYMKMDKNVKLPVWADSILLQRFPLAKETYYQIQQQSSYKGPKSKAPKDSTTRYHTIKPITEESRASIAERPGDKKSITHE